jgi:hypothetical protein
MGMRGLGRALLAIGISQILFACTAAPDEIDEALASPDPQTQQARALELILRGNERQRLHAVEVLRASSRCALRHEEIRDLGFEDPPLAAELAWRWLQLPSVDLFQVEDLGLLVLDLEKRELVDVLRRLDPEHQRTGNVYEQAVCRTPHPEDGPWLKKQLVGPPGGINGAAAGLVRLGDPAGLRPLLEQIGICPELWGRDAAVPLPERELNRRIAGVLLDLMRGRFTDPAIRAILSSFETSRFQGVHAVLADRLGMRVELLKMAEAGVEEAVCLLAAYPGEDTLAVLRKDLSLRENVGMRAMESLALLGDPELPDWIATHLDLNAEADPWSREALGLRLRKLAAPLPDEATGLAESSPEEEKKHPPLPVHADWKGLTADLVTGPPVRIVTNPAEWTHFWWGVRRPAPRIDFTKYAAVVLIYEDPTPFVIAPFDLQVAGMEKDSSGTVLHLLRVRSSFGFDAVEHEGTLWRVLVVPRSLLPLRVEAKDVSS